MIEQLYEPFREWSNGGAVYLLSDTHFDDSDCRLMDPTWITPAEQISIINKTVNKNDTLILLGDIGNPIYLAKIKARRKILIKGNHDSISLYKELFDEIYCGPLFISDRILLSHEPINGLPWCLNIHGHDHNNKFTPDKECKHINLAANICNFIPVSLAKIVKSGVMKDIKTIHRTTINNAIERKQDRKNCVNSIK